MLKAGSVASDGGDIGGRCGRCDDDVDASRSYG